MNEDLPPSIQLVLYLFLLALFMTIMGLLLLYPLFRDKTAYRGYIEQSELFLEAPRTVYMPGETLAMKGGYYYNLIDQYEDWDTDLMHRIMLCESRGNPRTVGDKNTPYRSYGLLQVRNLPSRELNVEDLFEPEENIKIAYEIFQRQSYWAWANCYKYVR